MNKLERRYDIEWLRTIGVLLVIPFHSLLIFNSNPESIMYIKDTVNVRSFNILDSVIDRFHMPLLFVIAGMSVYFSLQSRTINKFMQERIRKLLIPAIFGCIVLNPIMTYVYLISQNKENTFLEHFINFFTKNPGDFTGLNGAFTPAHLWFIIFLFAFSLVGVPLFSCVIEGNCNKLLSNIANFFEKPLMLILMVIPITVISAINILGDKNPLVYFTTFLMGFLLATDEKYLKAIDRDKWVYLIISVIIIYMKFILPDKFETWSLKWIIYGFFNRATRVIPVLALIGLASEFMNKNTKALNYLSKASFPVYILHMIFNTIIVFFVIKLSISPELKYIVIVVVTFTICFSLYEVIRRIKFLCFIFGIKVFLNII